MSSASSRPAIYVAEHANPQGEGDARPTALQIVKDEGLLNSGLVGRVALITGCSSGIGVETARALYATGADVFITVRDVAKGESVLADIRASAADSKGKIELVKMELDKISSVRAGAADFLKRSGGKINLLINNAGVMACPFSKTEDGLETQFGVCHIAHFLLFQLLKDALLKSATKEFPSRVVSLASVGHRFGSVRLNDFNFEEKDSYTPWGAYGQAKTANIWFANELERRYGSRNLHATSVMPGGIFTPLQRHLDSSVTEGWKKDKGVSAMMKSPAQGAATTVWAAISKEWAHKGGKYLEDCSETGPVDPKDQSLSAPGYAPHAYDVEGAKALWQKSLKIVGLEDEKDN